MLSEGILPMKMLDSYPIAHELTRWLNTVQPDLLLIDLADQDSAVRCATVTASHSPHTAVIGIGEGRSDSSLILASIGYPPQPEDLLRAVDHAVHRMRSSVESNLLAFIPAKAGSGASTVALNTAASLAKLKRRVLVIEADLRSGVMSIMLNVNPSHSVQEVLRSRDEMDLFRVRAAVTSALSVDFLLSSRASDGRLPVWEDYFRLLEIVKSRYDDILVDLPELVNPGTREIVQRCKLVFNVCTPELLSIKLAERRRQELSNWGVPEDRIGLILNRWHRGEIGAKDLERQMKTSVTKVFPNDYGTVRDSISAGQAVPGHTMLGQTFDEFAADVAGIFRREQPKETPTGLLGWLKKTDLRTPAPATPIAAVRIGDRLKR